MSDFGGKNAQKSISAGALGSLQRSPNPLAAFKGPCF